jgi:F0F1-type ATP synthase assembly protein I
MTTLFLMPKVQSTKILDLIRFKIILNWFNLATFIELFMYYINRRMRSHVFACYGYQFSLLDFGTLLTLWYFSVFISLSQHVGFYSHYAIPNRTCLFFFIWMLSLHKIHKTSLALTSTFHFREFDHLFLFGTTCVNWIIFLIKHLVGLSITELDPNKRVL